MPRNYNIRSIGFTTLLKIKREDFLNLLKEFPEDYESFCRIRDEIIFYDNFKSIGLNCFSCGSSNHQGFDCPFIHLRKE
jgi:hypothetical protein